MEGLFVMAAIGLALVAWGVRQMRRGFRQLNEIGRETDSDDSDPDQSNSA